MSNVSISYEINPRWHISPPFPSTKFKWRNIIYKVKFSAQDHLVRDTWHNIAFLYLQNRHLFWGNTILVLLLRNLWMIMNMVNLKNICVFFVCRALFTQQVNLNISSSSSSSSSSLVGNSTLYTTISISIEHCCPVVYDLILFCSTFLRHLCVSSSGAIFLAVRWTVCSSDCQTDHSYA